MDNENEIESLWLSLGIKPDDSSANDAVDKIIKAVQSKLKSSIYGGKNGVITLPATIEGKFKNGREIDKSITDAYAAIYEKAKQMADESVSLTLKDIKDFKAQIDKFGKQTAKYRNNDVIANANNNLRQTVATYQNYINELKGEVAKTKKTQVKQTQKVKAKQKAKTQQKGETAYDDYLKKQEQYSKRAEGAGKRKELFNELDEVRKEKSQYPQHIIRGVVTKKTLQETEYSGSYLSSFARQMARSRKEARKRELASLRVEKNKEKAEQHVKDLEEGKVKYKTKRQVIDKKPNGQWDVRYEDAEVYNKKPKQYTNEEKNELKRDVATNELAKILGGLEHRRKDASVQLFKNYMSGAFAFNTAAGKNDWDAIRESLEKTLNRYRGDKGTLGITDGTEKGVSEGHEEAVAAIKEMLDYMDKIIKQSEKQGKISVENARVLKELAKIDPKAANKYADELLGVGRQNTNSSNTVEPNSQLAKDIATMTSATEETNRAINQTNKLTTTQTTYDKIENASERVADTAQETEQKATTDANREEAKEITADAQTGFNADNNAKELLSAQSDLKGIIGKEIKDTLTGILSALSELKSLDGLNPATKLQADSSMQPCCDALTKLVEIAQHIDVTTGNVLQGLISMGAKLPTNLPALVKGETVKDKPIEKEPIVDKTDYEKLHNEKLNREIERERNTAFVTGAVDKYRSERAEKLKKIEAANKLKEIQNSAKSSLEIPGAVDIGANAEKMSTMSREQLKKIRAKRVTTFGLVDVDQNPTATGDLSRVQRVKATYGWGKNQANPFKDLKLSEGIEIDTKAITEALQNALQNNMFNAQTGGWFKNLIGPFTLYLGQDSLEKSRAEADAVNTIMAKMRDAAIDILQKIQNTQLDLQGMKESGKAVFKEDGTLDTEASDKSAITLFANLEEQKLALKGVLADVAMVDEVVENTGGNLTKILQQLGFAAPELANCNKIVKNLNAGLNKNGKVLKFQTRTAEILNYSFQLMGRYVGQIIKSWMTMLNPLSLIKRAFQDFTSYDTKWQRTMNVVKINFQRSIRPAMEWIAQKLVNMIGFFNIISMKVQEAFGQVPVDLFDQAGANAEKMRRELEKAANVTAGFDELHDIGSDNSGENDLLGDIYKPQLSKGWIDLANRIGDTFAHLIKGDMGFGDVCKEILRLLGELLGKIAKVIWDWFKETALGKWITDHWKGLLATLLALFVGWQLLKIFGPTLLSKIGGAFKTLFTKVGGWITTLLGANGFGQGIITAFQTLFAGGKYSLIGTLKEMFTSSAAITEAGSWGSMIGFAVTKGLLAALTGYATYKTIDHFGNKLADKTSYNLGVEYAGGKDKDKKGTGWAKAGAIGTGIIGGAATGALVGGAPGAAIGAVIGGIAGTIQSVLRPSLEEAEVAARSLNGELQNMHFNEAQVQTFQEQSDALSEQLDLLKQSLDTSTQSVYDQGEKLGISKTRMDELIASTQNGTFNTGMLTGAEVELSGSLTDLAQKQEHYTNVTKEAEEAEKKLLKAKTDLAIEQDMEAGNFEVAAARIEVAEAQKVYSTEEATDRRIELFKNCADEERANLLQDLTPDQKKRMTDLNKITDIELAKMHTSWEDSSETTRNAILNGLDENTQAEFKRRMDQIDDEIERHKGFWQSIGDTLAEIFSFGHATTWTYNGNEKYEDAVRNKKIKIQKNALGTNYVEADGLQYLHQGEAIIPKKYNQPYQPGGMSAEERAYMDRMIVTMNKLDGTISQGINIRGEFRQRGNDLVATVEKAKNRNGNQPLNNAVFAR